MLGSGTVHTDAQWLSGKSGLVHTSLLDWHGINRNKRPFPGHRGEAYSFSVWEYLQYTFTIMSFIGL